MKKILVILVVALVLIQFFPIDKNNPAPTPGMDFLTIKNTPESGRGKSKSLPAEVTAGLRQSDSPSGKNRPQRRSRQSEARSGRILPEAACTTVIRPETQKQTKNRRPVC